MIAGRVMIARQRVADQDGVAPVVVERPIGLVDQFVTFQPFAAFELQRCIEDHALGRDQTDRILGEASVRRIGAGRING